MSPVKYMSASEDIATMSAIEDMEASGTMRTPYLTGIVAIATPVPGSYLLDY
jgi:hypothetical protein